MVLNYRFKSHQISKPEKKNLYSVFSKMVRDWHFYLGEMEEGKHYSKKIESVHFIGNPRFNVDCAVTQEAARVGNFGYS